MADKREYDVLREHEGDRFYKRGETRTARPDDVGHLVRLGVLGEPGEKADPPLANKVEPPLANKAVKAKG